MAEKLPEDRSRRSKLDPVWRALVEAGFIIFLYYSNLLMGEFEGSGLGQRNGLGWALRDIFTGSNFMIAVASALVGYLVFEFLRKKFWGPS
ncbi:MAG: hypothetical protein ABSE59_07830 [Opitutaceae bacterium]|jgi:hypothetical protein